MLLQTPTGVSPTAIVANIELVDVLITDKLSELNWLHKPLFHQGSLLHQSG